MKKQSLLKRILIISSIFILLLTINNVNLVQAAKMVLSPSSSKSTVGRTITLNLDIDPVGDTIYTAKADIRFPTDMLSVDSWTFNKDWMALRQPEYDSLDNKAGILIRTGGFTGGVIERKRFGSITFKTKSEGTAVITINGKSFTLNADNSDKFTGGNTATIVIGKADVLTAEKKTTEPETITDLVYNASLVKTNVYIGETAVIVAKLNNPNRRAVSTTVKSTLYTGSGGVIAEKSNSVLVDTSTDVVQQIPTDSLSIGNYSLINEVTYDKQSTPQKTTLNFNVIPAKQLAVTDQDVNNYIQANYMYIAISAIIFAIIIGILIGKMFNSSKKKSRKSDDYEFLEKR